MSHAEEDDSRPWTDHDLTEALRRINAGEINLKEAENYYGISPRTIHRQRAIQNMRAQLNPEKAKKMKSAGPSTARKDVTGLRKPVEMSCASIGDIVSLLNDGTEEVKQLLNHECDLIYECKVCKSLFRSLLNFISHKRVYCCDMYSTVHTQSNENGDTTVTIDPSKVGENLKAKENLKEFASRPFRITCRKDLTTVLKRITSLSSEFVPAEPILHLQSMENTTCALQQTIKTSQPVKEPVLKLPESNTTSNNVPAVSQVESKKENSIKSPNKKTVTAKPVTYVPERRFKCPLCPSNYTTKKSVLRHLKSVHHKSVEQLERLKSRVQMFIVKKKNVVTTKNVSSSTSKPSTVTATSTVSAHSKLPSTSSGSSNESVISPNLITKNEQKPDKGDRERECSVCGRNFVNKSSYTSHTRSCRKNTSNNDDTDSKSDASVSPLVPVVSLTPIVAPKLVQKIENDGNCTTKKMTTMTSQSKKVGLPLSTSSSSSSKKIGIQVRMNYRKDGINQPISTNSTPVGYATPSGVLVDSADSSRRSSTVSTIPDEKSDVTKTDLLKGHTTRSKLANILKTLYDKRGIKDENEDPKITGMMKRIEKNEVSIYCEDCKTTYALNDYKWNSENGVLRNYKCALNGCDFRSTCKSELLPHLSDRHPVLSENELSEVDSIFIAESSGSPPDSEKCSCHRGTSRDRSVDRRKREVTANARTVPSQNLAPPKRKLGIESEEKMAKRRVILGLKKKDISSTAEEETENETNSAILTDVNKTEVVKHQSLKTDKKLKDNLLLKKKKLVPKESYARPFRIRAKKQKPVDTAVCDIIPNGLESLSDEQTQFATLRLAKKQNLSTEETKIATKLPKINSLVDSSPYSLAPYTDLDPATMTEENLKKSVMTIIFGKDISDENVEANFVDTREKSPSSSSTSSDGGKEKRYGLRAGKTVSSTSNKIVIASSLPENKDEKVLKFQILNKVKNAPR